MIYEAYRKQNRKITTRYLKKIFIAYEYCTMHIAKILLLSSYLFIRGQIRIREKVE